MSEVSSSLPTEPVLVYLSDPALPDCNCVHLLIPHIRIVGVGNPPPFSPLFLFKTLPQA